MPLEFSTARRVIFGAGSAQRLPDYIRDLGGRALFVVGSSPDRYARWTGQGVAVFSQRGEPSFDGIRAITEASRAVSCDVVVGIGGGSVLDAAKAVAMLLANGGDPLDYAEVVGAWRAIEKPSVPCICVPTTAGTGSEATRNAVLSSPEHGVKVSLRSPLMLPALALVDPCLTYDLPPSVTASTGMDALSQLIESFVSCRANPITDSLCRAGIPRAVRALPVAYREPNHAAARADLSQAALWSGMTLANAGLGAVHGFAAPIGGLFHAPHGAVCAILLAPVVAANARAMGDHAKFVELATLVTGKTDATIDEAVETLSTLTSSLRIPRLSTYGIRSGHIPDLVAKAKASSSMKGNPVQLADDVLAGILQAAL